MGKALGSITVVFNLFSGAEPQGCIPVARENPVYISAQERWAFATSTTNEGVLIRSIGV